MEAPPTRAKFTCSLHEFPLERQDTRVRDDFVSPLQAALAPGIATALTSTAEHAPAEVDAQCQPAQPRIPRRLQVTKSSETNDDTPLDPSVLDGVAGGAGYPIQACPNNSPHASHIWSPVVWGVPYQCPGK